MDISRECACFLQWVWRKRARGQPADLFVAELTELCYLSSTTLERSEKSTRWDRRRLCPASPGPDSGASASGGARTIRSALQENCRCTWQAQRAATADGRAGARESATGQLLGGITPSLFSRFELVRLEHSPPRRIRTR